MSKRPKWVEEYRDEEARKWQHDDRIPYRKGFNAALDLIDKVGLFEALEESKASTDGFYNSLVHAGWIGQGMDDMEKLTYKLKEALHTWQNGIKEE